MHWYKHLQRKFVAAFSLPTMVLGNFVIPRSLPTARLRALALHTRGWVMIYTLQSTSPALSFNHYSRREQEKRPELVVKSEH